MKDWPEPTLLDMLKTIAVARLLLGGAMNLQAPPNLTPDAYQLLLLAGINDWGGVSPLTIDFINPEAPWPKIKELQRVTADVGIAIGAGTDVAVEAGDVVLVRSDPRDVPRIIALSRATYRKMVQNLWWAAGYNIVAIPLAAGVLAPWGIVLSPAIGAVLMSLSTIIVAANAQLLRRADLG